MQMHLIHSYLSDIRSPSVPSFTNSECALLISVPYSSLHLYELWAEKLILVEFPPSASATKKVMVLKTSSFQTELKVNILVGIVSFVSRGL